MGLNSCRLVLSGGGIRGAAQAGAIFALEEAKINIDMVVGTSIGALNGALLASGKSPEEIVDYWYEEASTDLYKLNWGGLFRKGFYTLDRLAENLREKIHDCLMYELSIPLIIPAVRYGDGKQVNFGADNSHACLVDVVMASCAIPGFFVPWKVDGEDYIDGGVTDYLPIGLAEKYWGEEEKPPIVAVHVGAKTLEKKFKGQSQLVDDLTDFWMLNQADDIVDRYAGVSVEELARNPKKDLLLCHPDTFGAGIKDFDKIDDLINEGYKEMKKVIRKYEETWGEEY